MYEVFLERGAERDLRRLTPLAFQQIIAAIRVLAENPRPRGSRKLSGSRNDWRIRIRDFRIIYEVDDRAKAVRVMHIRHRREAYR